MTAQPGERPTFVISPPPTPNGPLHVGHLSGPYLAADIAVRAARARGEAVLSVCGTDDHQNYVADRARRERRTAESVVNEYRGQIGDVFAAVYIGHDIFTTPYTDRAYQDAVLQLYDRFREQGLVRAGRAPVPGCAGCGRTLHHAYVAGRCPRCGARMGGGTCEGCGGFAGAADLLDPACTGCGAGPAPAHPPAPVFALEEYRAGLLRVWAQASVPVPVRRLLADLLDRELPEVPVSYPTDWGLPAGAGRLDVWFEMGLAYLWLVARELDPRARSLAEHARAWQQTGGLWPFLGLDNAFYYAVLFPAMLLAAGVPASHCLSGLVVNQFYRLDGEKFSTSRDHAVWGEEILKLAEPDAVREFLSLDRPAPHATNFTLAEFQRFLSSRPPGGRGYGPPATGGEAARAAQALRLEHFDPALAVRCALPAAGAGDPEAGRLLELVRGRAPAVPDRAP